MLKQGAKLVETPDDVLEEFGLVRARPVSKRAASAPIVPPSSAWASAHLPDIPADADAARVLTALGHAPATLEILAARTEMDGAGLQGAPPRLELAGRLVVLPGGRYAALERS